MNPISGHAAYCHKARLFWILGGGFKAKFTVLTNYAFRGNLRRRINCAAILGF
jgi:hypothetical protein